MGCDDSTEDEQPDALKTACEKSGGVYDTTAKQCQCGENLCVSGVVCDAADKAKCADALVVDPVDPVDPNKDAKFCVSRRAHQNQKTPRIYELRNSRVLVLAPKKLRSNRTQYKSDEITNPFANVRFNYDVLNHTDLTRENGYGDNINLATLNYENYDLLVINESHNFRTDSSASESMTRYNKILRDICQKGVHTRVLLLSATPVNKRIKDLTSQLKFITTGDDAAFEALGIESLDNLTRVAQSRFNRWSKLPVEERTFNRFMTDMELDYFKLLDTITIARSRKHIEANYNIPDLGKFPTRNRPINIVPETLNTERRVLIKTINDLGADQLTLAIFAPLNALKVEAEPKYRKQFEEIKGTAFSTRALQAAQLMPVTLNCIVPEPALVVPADVTSFDWTLSCASPLKR